MRPFFADVRVRQAMTMLIPRQQIIDTVQFGLGEVAVSTFSPMRRTSIPILSLSLTIPTVP